MRIRRAVVAVAVLTGLCVLFTGFFHLEINGTSAPPSAPPAAADPLQARDQHHSAANIAKSASVQDDANPDSAAQAPDRPPRDVAAEEHPVEDNESPVILAAAAAHGPAGEALEDGDEHPRTSPVPETRVFELRNSALSLVFKQIRTGSKSDDMMTLQYDHFTNQLPDHPRVLKPRPELFVILAEKLPPINSTTCGFVQPPELAPDSSELRVEFSCSQPRARVWYSVSLGPSDHFLRIRVRWQLDDCATGRDVHFRYFIALSLPSQGLMQPAAVQGAVLVNLAHLSFWALESPLGATGTLRSEPSVAVCGLTDLPNVPCGKSSSTYSAVFGVFAERILYRRSFIKYLEAVRARPSRPYLHYNSWFDFYSWQEPNVTLSDRKMTEESCLERVHAFAEELVVKRNAPLKSLLWDDGWDDHSSLWSFHDDFPNGFSQVGAAAREHGFGIGVWLSPWGGYGEAQEKRLETGRQQGYRVNSAGFTLADERYNQRFRSIALEMVRKYGVNMFKFDGVNFQGEPANYVREMENMLGLLQNIREEADEDDVFINLTTGTWPSPFFLMYSDSIWRGHGDLGIHGVGSRRQQWTTYRDAVVHLKVVSKSPLFPLSSLMLHGIVAGTAGEARFVGLGAPSLNISHFADEVWSYFGMGVMLQELYISYDIMDPKSWDVVADAAKWANARKELFVDSHWVGGNPVELQLYGFAAYNGTHGAITLRNPLNVTRTAELHLEGIWEIPGSERSAPWRIQCTYLTDAPAARPCLHGLIRDRTTPNVVPLESDGTALLHLEGRYLITLQALQVLVLDGVPAPVQ
eukprot:m.113663 g.113663  ORF g.113663 m.113663 type:complete len:806 (+) comp9425_c0_seq2:124-2541(+)